MDIYHPRHKGEKEVGLTFRRNLQDKWEWWIIRGGGWLNCNWVTLKQDKHFNDTVLTYYSTWAEPMQEDL